MLDFTESLRQLVETGLVEDAGHDGEGGSTLYRTTTYFLERLGLPSLAALPSLAPLLSGGADDLDVADLAVEPTSLGLAAMNDTVSAARIV